MKPETLTKLTAAYVDNPIPIQPKFTLTQANNKIAAIDSAKRYRRAHLELCDEVEEKVQGTTFLDKAQLLANIASVMAEVDPKVAVTCIQELNKMQGHYAPTRTINDNRNLNVNATVDESYQLLKDLRKEY